MSSVHACIYNDRFRLYQIVRMQSCKWGGRNLLESSENNQSPVDANCMPGHQASTAVRCRTGVFVMTGVSYTRKRPNGGPVWSRQVTIDSNRHVGSRHRRFSPNPHRRSPPRRPCGRQMTNIHGPSVNRCLVTRQIMTNIHGLKTESSWILGPQITNHPWERPEYLSISWDIRKFDECKTWQKGNISWNNCTTSALSVVRDCPQRPWGPFYWLM